MDNDDKVGASRHAEPNARLRALPSVDDVLQARYAALAVAKFGRTSTIAAIRRVLDAHAHCPARWQNTAEQPEAIANTAQASLAADARPSCARCST